MSAYPEFLANKVKDGHGRYISEIHCFNYREIEHTCDFLQWVFPTHVASPIEPRAWVLTAEDIYRIRRWPDAIGNHIIAVQRMKRFFENTSEWLTVGDHNHKRITRIIDNISLVSCMRDARIFWERIAHMNVDAGGPVNPTTLAFWRHAAGFREMPIGT